MMPKAIVDKLTLVIEKLFADLGENLESAARYERNGDASTALYGVAHAINMMDIPYLIREALEIPHDAVNDTPVVADFDVGKIHEEMLNRAHFES